MIVNLIWECFIEFPVDKFQITWIARAPGYVRREDKGTENNKGKRYLLCVIYPRFIRVFSEISAVVKADINPGPS